MPHTFISPISFGAYLLVKDEELRISAALRSLEPFVSQIVVVDTGSNDSTPQICSRFGAEVHFLQWSKNFATARNYALEKMRTDWVIALDADEILQADSFTELFSLFENPNVGGFSVKIFNQLSEDIGATQSIHSYTRIFRNHLKICYTGVVHEQIADSILAAGFRILESPVCIQHFGYANISEEKIARNASLLRSELENNPDDAWLLYHLGQTEFAAKNYKIAFDLLRKAIDLQQLNGEQKEFAIIRLAQICLANDDIILSEKLTNFQCNDVHREGLRLFIRATIFAIQHKFEEAKALILKEEIWKSSLVDKIQAEKLKILCNKITSL